MAREASQVTILFARRDSVYKTIAGCDTFDAERDARTWPGGTPIIAHPPCRLFSRMRPFSTAPAEEKQLAFFALDMVRQYGGVLEHPYSSTLWREANLPMPGQGKDAYGGWTLIVPQWWWGHKARKLTWLYIVGAELTDLPPIPYRLGEAEYVCCTSARGPDRKPKISPAEREHTTLEFAHWLVALARKCVK